MDRTKEVSVPNNLEGLSESKACEKIEKEDLVCKVKYEYNSEYDITSKPLFTNGKYYITYWKKY